MIHQEPAQGPWMRAACCLAEGKVWRLPHCKASCYVPINWCKKREVKAGGAEAVAFLMQERRHPELSRDRRRPSPIPAPSSSRKEEKERNLAEGNPQLQQREFPPAAPGPAPERGFVAP